MRTTAYVWNPFAELEALTRGFGRFFDSPTLRDDLARAISGAVANAAAPLANVREERDAFHVQILAPGANPESFNVTVQGTQLRVTGEKLPLAAEEGVSVHRRERAAGKFARLVELPAEVDREKTSAEYRDGVLRITLPKAEAAKPREIAVKVG